MARGINNIDPIVAMLHGSNFGGNSNTAFLFLITTVHNEVLAHFGLVVTKSLGLF